MKMPDQVTTKMSEALPQKQFDFNEEIEPNEDLLKGNEQEFKRGGGNLGHVKGKKKVKLT